MTQLGLQPRGWFDVEKINNVERHTPAYEVCLILGGVGTANSKRFEMMIGGEEFDGTPHDGLLGRDVLKFMQVVWNGPTETLRVSYE